MPSLIEHSDPPTGREPRPSDAPQGRGAEGSASQPAQARSRPPRRPWPPWLRTLAASTAALAVMIGVTSLIVAGMIRAHRPPAVASGILRDAGGVERLIASEEFARGKQHFVNSCTACHEPDGGAKPGLGVDVVRSEFTASLTDAELATFIRRGRSPWDPNSQTGVDMPPRGGNPALREEHIADIVVYIRGLQAMAEAKPAE